MMGKRVERRDNLEGLGVNVMLKLKFNWTRTWKMADFLQCGNWFRYTLLHFCALYPVILCSPRRLQNKTNRYTKRQTNQ